MFKEIPANKASIANRKLAYGVAINDSDYKTCVRLNGKKMLCPFYARWLNMINRCYSEEYQSDHPTYVGCTICSEWLIFSNFKAWMSSKDWENKELDKDIKYTGNKIYSPNNCLFVTREINNLFNDHAAKRGRYPRGVDYNKSNNKFRSRCNADSKSKCLGHFDTEEAASKAYKVFKLNLILLVAEKQDQPLRGYLIRIAGELTS